MCGQVRSTGNVALQKESDHEVARQEEFPIFLRTNGQPTQVVTVTRDSTIGHLQGVAFDIWGIPTDQQHIVYPGTLRALQVYDTLGQYNISKDATLYVFPRACGGMQGFMQHLTPKRATPLHTMGTLPPLPPIPNVAQATNSSATSNLQQKVQFYVNQGKSSLYQWEGHDTPPGLKLGDRFFHDEKLVCPRQEMIRVMASVQLWTVEISGGVSTPNTGKHILPPVLESINLLSPGDVAFWFVPTNTSREDKWDHSIPWTGNHHQILEGLELRKPTVAPPISFRWLWKPGKHL